MKDTITDDQLAALVKANGARDPLVTQGPGGVGWKLQIRYSGGSAYHVLRSRREPVRVFRTLDSLHRYCAKIGLRGFTVEG
ncbi:hypothetical protein [Pseudomonas nitroreducens]|uniref:hypothetical protein n=1 Tax=Pseudomonas nitroreducens TaxID=46680 RepID=UPI00265A4E13|nr:hypothetical protein [Pseudomonas nitroreducens]MCP1652713.1 hypothetical protein [Pseudomonas nitroreducens]